MRHRSAVVTTGLVVGLMLAGCSSSSSGGGALVASPSASPTSDVGSLFKIPEKFTLLPCPTPANTTLAMEGCAEHKIVALDRQLTATAREVYASLQTSAERQQLVESFTAWIAARAATCTKAANAYAGGTLAPVAYANCEVSQNRKQLARLRGMVGSTSP